MPQITVMALFAYAVVKGSFFMICCHAIAYTNKFKSAMPYHKMKGNDKKEDWEANFE